MIIDIKIGKRDGEKLFDSLFTWKTVISFSIRQNKLTYVHINSLDKFTG